MERLKNDIKTSQFQHAYLLYGEEAYLRKYYKNALKAAIIGDDNMNYSYFEGKDTEPRAILDMAQTLPFFAQRRMILVENSGFFKSGCEELENLFLDIPDYLYLVFVEPEADKRTRLFKAVSSKGSCVQMVPFTGDKQKVWVSGLLKRYGKKMSERDIEYLLKLTGDDMVNIESEVEKLVDYTGEREIVTAKDAEIIVTRQIGDNIFKMVGAIGERNQKKALGYYYELLERREAPFKILSLIARQFNILLQVRELKAKRLAPKEIASEVSVPPYYINEYMAQASNFSEEELKAALGACVKADEDIKLGRMSDTLSVELLIVEFSKRKEER